MKSALDFFETYEINEFGRPIFIEDEVQTCVAEHIEFAAGDQKKGEKTKEVKLTTHRILLETSKGERKALHLQNVFAFEKKGGGIFGGARVVLSLSSPLPPEDPNEMKKAAAAAATLPPSRTAYYPPIGMSAPAQAPAPGYGHSYGGAAHPPPMYGHKYAPAAAGYGYGYGAPNPGIAQAPYQQVAPPPVPSYAASRPQPSAQPPAAESQRKRERKVEAYLSVVFAKKGLDQFAVDLKRMMESKHWEKQQKKEKREFSCATVLTCVAKALNAGVGGLMREAEQKSKKTDQDMQEAFSDMKALMVHAKDMVALAKKFTEDRTKHDGEGGNAEGDDMDDMLKSVGLTSLVTKKTAGNRYHEELARELTEVLSKPVEDAGGMLSLVDCYCIYNRLRGTDLVSPEDVYAAFETSPSLQLPLSLRKFPSGVVVVQKEGFNEKDNVKKVIDFVLSLERAAAGVGKDVEEIDVQFRKGITVTDVAKHFRMSFELAKQTLLMGEEMQSLCRDESIEGL